MSAPKTDLDKQKRQHRGPLLGMRAVVLWALVLLALLVGYLVVRDDPVNRTSTPATDAPSGDAAPTTPAAQ